MKKKIIFYLRIKLDRIDKVWRSGRVPSYTIALDTLEYCFIDINSFFCNMYLYCTPCNILLLMIDTFNSINCTLISLPLIFIVILFPFTTILDYQDSQDHHPPPPLSSTPFAFQTSFQNNETIV